jgi:hypothetical protein
MAQELIFNKSVAIIGGGPAGCICAKYLQDFGIEVSIFDKGKPLRTLLPTGGGRCNLTHAQYDFKDLAKNYPRGEKFLYSVFSRFGVGDTIDFFDRIGIKTYTQDDNRIFPQSNSSKDVQYKLLKSIGKCRFIRENVEFIEYKDDFYKIGTNKSSYAFDIVVIAIGGHSNFKLLENLKIPIIEPTQALVGLTTKEDFSTIAGVSIKDVLFTHKGVSGPYIYKLSSINARKSFPYTIVLNLNDILDFQEKLNSNPHKEIKNLLGQIIPKSLAEWILKDLGIDIETPCHKINGKVRDKIQNRISKFEITVTGKVPDGEVVTCGGVDLKSVNSKTLSSKLFPNLYFCGEVLDIDGFCGGFNLQNCWSSGFVVADSIIKNYQ